MNRTRLATVFAVLAVGGGALLIKGGVYGFSLFLLVPSIIGAFAAWLAKPRSGMAAAGWGALGPCVACLGLFLLGCEGLYCIAMALPLVAPLGAFGGLLYHHFKQTRLRQSVSAMLLMVPIGTLGFDLSAQPPVFAITTTVEIAAPPERVWPHVIAYAEMPEQPDWMFRNGIGYPQRVRMDGAGAGGTRFCDFSTGSFVEPIEAWDPPYLLRFRVTSSPPPMHELSFYKHVEPKHLHGYFLSKEGEFRLTPLPNGHTRVDGTSWYQHGLWPAQYWRVWSDRIVHRVHERVLNHIRVLAEAPTSLAGVR